MHTKLIKEKLFEQTEVYRAVKNGNVSLVCYNGFRDEEWGNKDANYQNRMRLSYYLLYAGIEDANTALYLFSEELKDRRTNSFQGIGNALNVLTAILNKYNSDGKYDKLLEEAQNANFDCACGYDKNFKMDDDIEALSLMDCIYLSQDLGYKDVMEVLVKRWKEEIVEWTGVNRAMLIGFNSFLGKEHENEILYVELLNNAAQTGKTFEIISAYNDVIRYYIDTGRCDTAYSYMRKMMEKVDFKEIERIRLFGDVLEECLEIICNGGEWAKELWIWAKPYLQERTNMYGNLYIKGVAAAKAVNDSYSIQLEAEYCAWKKSVGLK